MYNPIPKSLALTNISELKKNVCVCLGQLCAYNSCQAQYVIISLEGGGTWTKKRYEMYIIVRRTNPPITDIKPLPLSAGRRHPDTYRGV